MHRAFTHFRLGPTNLVNAVSLFAFFQFVWLRFLPDVCRFWNWVLLLGVRVLPLRAEVAVSHHHLTHLIRFDISYLRMEPVLPSPLVWSLTCAVTLMLFASTFFQIFIAWTSVGTGNGFVLFRIFAGSFSSHS